MTDARYPEKWLTDRRILRLSASQYRAFVMALAWSVSNRTDGLIEPGDVDLIAGRDLDVRTCEALVMAGLWNEVTRGWQIVDFATSQTSASELEVLDNTRRRDREKKARQRQHRKDGEAVPRDVPGDVPGDVSPGTAQARTGQARPGKALDVEPPTDSKPKASGWADVVVAVPGALVSVDCICAADLPPGEHFPYCRHAKASA